MSQTVCNSWAKRAPEIFHSRWYNRNQKATLLTKAVLNPLKQSRRTLPYSQLGMWASQTKAFQGYKKTADYVWAKYPHYIYCNILSCDTSSIIIDPFGKWKSQTFLVSRDVTANSLKRHTMMYHRWNLLQFFLNYCRIATLWFYHYHHQQNIWIASYHRVPGPIVRTNSNVWDKEWDIHWELNPAYCAFNWIVVPPVFERNKKSNDFINDWNQGTFVFIAFMTGIKNKLHGSSERIGN